MSFGLDDKEYGRMTVDEQLFLSVHGEPVLAVSDLHIVGAHNQMNALAAMALADAVGVPRQAQISVLKSFTGVITSYSIHYTKLYDLCN